MNISPVANYNPVGVAIPADKLKLQALLAHKHFIEFAERIEWGNLPPELKQDLIERVLYFRSKGALFKGVDDKFLFLPFTLSGNIDVYGRYIEIIPTLFTGDNSSIIHYNSAQPLKVVYNAGDEGDAVILTDSTLEISQDLTPPAVLISPILEQMVEILVLVNIDLINSAKVWTIVAEDEAQKRAIEMEFEGLDAKILNGKRVIVVTSKQTLQELSGEKNSKDSNRYFQVYQSFDNLRKDILGISNAGTFMKNSIQTDSEVAQNQNQGTMIMQNALRQRQEFCDIVNKLWGLNITVKLKDAEVADTVGVPSNNSDRNDDTIEEDE